MVALISTPTLSTFEELISRAEREVTICSPFVGREPCERIVELLRPGVSLRIMCDLGTESVLSGATRPDALALVHAARPDARVLMAPSLHAKVYLADDRAALVTSANMTRSGMCANLEYGVLIQDDPLVTRVRADTERMLALGTPLTAEDLLWMERARTEHARAFDDARRTAASGMRELLRDRFGAVDEGFLRLRAAGRAPHAIFADAIRHLLRAGPQSTVELHERIRALHPDFCDDSVDRVIDGRHFGKKWKHAVRTAQQMLRTQAVIERTEERWALREPSTDSVPVDAGPPAP